MLSGLSENIYNQNCAAEFMMKFLDRLETMTKGSVHEQLMKFHFSGELVNQTIRYSDDADGGVVSLSLRLVFFHKIDTVNINLFFFLHFCYNFRFLLSTSY